MAEGTGVQDTEAGERRSGGRIFHVALYKLERKPPLRIELIPSLVEAGVSAVAIYLVWYYMAGWTALGLSSIPIAGAHWLSHHIQLFFVLCWVGTLVYPLWSVLCLHYERYRADMDAEPPTLCVDTAPFGRDPRAMPLESIGGVKVKSPISGRIFGLSDLHISSAGTGTPPLHLRGLTDARYLAEVLAPSTWEGAGPGGMMELGRGQEPTEEES